MRSLSNTVKSAYFPIPMEQGPLAVIVVPPPLWVSIVGMFVLSALTVAISVLIVKRLEVKYTDE